jgi:hypothetical protein
VRSIYSFFTKNSSAEIFLFCGALLSVLWSVYFSCIVISTPHQIEIREGTALVLTGFLLRGENPFVLQSQPLTMNQYGFGYNLVVLPFAALFGNTLFIHRLIALVFILLCAVLGYWAVYTLTRNPSVSLSCAALILIVLIGRAGVGAFPSAMGTFLFLLALWFPFLRSFDKPSLLVSVLAVIVAFYTKPYFLLSFGIVFSYLFLFVSKRKSMEYGLFFAVPFVLSFLVVSRFFPLYFINIIISNTSNRGLSINHLGLQLIDLAYFLSPVLILWFLDFRKKIFSKTPVDIKNQPGWIDFKNWHQPFIVHSFDFPVYSFFCCLLTFIFILGPHEGSFMNYAYQLVVPPFFLLFFQRVRLEQGRRWVFVVLVLLNLLTLIWNIQPPQMLKQGDPQQWAKVSDYLRSGNNILNSMAVTSEIVAMGKVPMDSGQTEYYFEVEPFSEDVFSGTSYETLLNNGILYVDFLDGMIEDRKFDLVITVDGVPSFYNEDLLQDYYQIVDKIDVDMPQADQSWTLIFWKPLAE